MRLVLIRHPRPAVAAGVCYGVTDLDVADDVRELAATLRRELPRHVSVFSSPLRRCRLLAEALCDRTVLDKRLSEIDFGAWEMQPWDRIARAELDAWAAAPLAYTPPRGEAVQSLRRRALQFLQDRLDGGADCVAITHAGVIRVLAGHVRGLAETDWLGLRIGYGERIVLDCG